MFIVQRLFVWFCVAALLAACASPSPALVAQETEPSPAATALPVVAPSAPTATPTAAPTAVPPSPTPSPSPTPLPSPTPTPITGELALPRGLAPQRLIAIMLDNHPAAYPQVGMDHAVLVFEALAEFGITRYMMVLAPGISPEAAMIGPVRSARSYFVEWAKGLNAVYVHAGGSPDGLLLSETAIEIANMDALRGDASAYFRRSGDRAAPHNLFTGSADLERFVVAQDAASFDPAEQGFIFKLDAPPEQRPASQQIDYYFIYAEEMAGWVYDQPTNSYLRLRRGRPHVDGRTGQQLRFKNIVVMEVPEKPIPNDPQGRIEQRVLGEGRARLFVDGLEREIIWRKATGFAPLRFYDAAGDEVALNAGPVWVAAIPTLSHLTVKGGG